MVSCCLYLVLYLVFGVACGLPYPIVLHPPIIQSGTSGLKFSHDTRNNTIEFQGYQLFYKLYRTEDEYRIDQEDIEENTVLSSDILTQNGFQPVIIGILTADGFKEKDTTGTIKIADKAAAITFSIEGAANNEIELVVRDATNTRTSQILRRNTSSANNKPRSSYKSFVRYTESDVDVQLMGGNSPPSFQINKIGFAIIAYGRDTRAAALKGRPIALAAAFQKIITKE